MYVQHQHDLGGIRVSSTKRPQVGRNAVCRFPWKESGSRSRPGAFSLTLCTGFVSSSYK